MGFALLSYSDATGGAVVDHDMGALVDAEFGQRNSHYVFTEQYNLLAAAAFGATMTRLNMNPPHWNAISPFNVWPINRSLNTPSPCQIAWYDDRPPSIPMLEEFKIRDTDTAAETTQALLWIGTSDWNRNIPAGPLFEVRATASVAGIANVWSSLGALTFEQGLRSGVYCVVGATCWSALGNAFRLVFPHSKMYFNRKLRPGMICQNAVGDLLEAKQQIHPLMFGEWGRFHVFEPPQLELLSNTTGAATQELRMWLVYLGEGDATSVLQSPY